MRHMRLPALLFLLMSPSACIDLQGSYTAEARDQCRDIINADERRECMRRVAENDSARRAERRSDQ